MFFKKKEITEKIQSENASVRPQNASAAKINSSVNEKLATPVYKKPVLRRYDQIDQVKPYGPSEI